MRRPRDISELIERDAPTVPAHKALPDKPMTTDCPPHIARAWMFWLQHWYGMNPSTWPKVEGVTEEEAEKMLLLVNQRRKELRRQRRSRRLQGAGGVGMTFVGPALQDVGTIQENFPRQFTIEQVMAELDWENKARQAIVMGLSQDFFRALSEERNTQLVIYENVQWRRSWLTKPGCPTGYRSWRHEHLMAYQQQGTGRPFARIPA